MSDGIRILEESLGIGATVMLKPTGIACLTILICTSGGPLSAQIRVGDNVHVSHENGELAHFETIVSHDPNDPSRLMAGSHIMYADNEGPPSSSVVYVSHDGGRNWYATLEPRDSTAGNDPTPMFTSSGAALYTSLARVPMYRSSDGGLTWNEPTRPPANDIFGWDRPFMSVDMNEDSPFFGNVYLHATLFARGLAGGRPVSGLGLFTSTDDGRTFGYPIFRPGSISPMANSAVLSDGTLVMLYGVNSENRAMTSDGTEGASIYVAISKDGGKNIEEVEVSRWSKNVRRSQGAALPWIAVDPGSPEFTDRLYVVWSDFSEAYLQIRFTYSSDGGRSWSIPQVIDRQRPSGDPSRGPDAILPLVAANRDGVVAIVWYDRRESSDNLGWRLRTTASLDGGETWLPSRPVSEVPSTFDGSERWTPHVLALPPMPADTARSGGGVRTIQTRHYNFDFSPGHTSGFAAAADNRFHAIWINNRTGVSQLWAAPITVQGTVARNGGGELRGYADLGGMFALEVVDRQQNRERGELILKTRLTNVSGETLHGPQTVRVRLLDLASDIGKPSVINAVNGIDGVGAVWDFSSTIPEAGLPPGASGEVKDLVFRFSDIRPFQRMTGRGVREQLDVLIARAKILGPGQDPE